MRTVFAVHPRRPGFRSLARAAITLLAAATPMMGAEAPEPIRGDLVGVSKHAASNSAGGLHPYVYPAWGHAILIDYLLDYASWSGADPKMAAAGTALIPALVEVIEAHKTPSDWLYGDLYYSTGSRSQMGGQPIDAHAARALSLFLAV
jgi:hypothetical protein